VGGSFKWYLLSFANGVGASAKMWLWVMIMVVKTLNHHQMIHFCVDVVIATSTYARNDILDFGPCQKKHDGKYCGYQSYLGLQKTEKTVLVACIIKTSMKNHLLLLFPLCVLK
jgi:hypothetical protein